MNHTMGRVLILGALLALSGCSASQVAPEDDVGLVLLERTPACTYSALHMETTEVGRWVSMNEAFNRRSFQRDVHSRARNVPKDLEVPNAVIVTPMSLQGAMATVRLLYINANPICLGAKPTIE